MFEGALFEPWHAISDKFAPSAEISECIPPPAHPASGGDAFFPPSGGLLGTTTGLLLHELAYSSEEFLDRFGALISAGANIGANGSPERDMLVWFELVLFLARIVGRMDLYVEYTLQNVVTSGEEREAVQRARKKLRPGIEKAEHLLER